jgi:hypothetical protein
MGFVGSDADFPGLWFAVKLCSLPVRVVHWALEGGDTLWWLHTVPWLFSAPFCLPQRIASLPQNLVLKG